MEACIFDINEIHIDSDKGFENSFLNQLNWLEIHLRYFQSHPKPDKLLFEPANLLAKPAKPDKLILKTSQKQISSL